MLIVSPEKIYYQASDRLFDFCQLLQITFNFPA